MDKPGRSPTVRKGSKAKPRTLRDLGTSAADDQCKIHGTTLKLMKVPVRYGLPARDEELWEARGKLFPNSKRYVLGGCMVDAIGHEYETLVCDECRQAETAWRRKNWHRD